MEMEIAHLVEMSKYAGERTDLVQAGGGNSSVKCSNGEMLIKASGFLLSDVEENQGYATVNTQQVAAIVHDETILNATEKKEMETISGQLVKAATVVEGVRPSIETLLHSLLKKYTLHTHPLVVNMVVVRENWKEILKDIFSDDELVLVNYRTPGIELALELNAELEKIGTVPELIFLQNHGLIVTSDQPEQMAALTDYVVTKIEAYLQLDMQQYRNVTELSKLFRSNGTSTDIVFLSEDRIINDLVKTNRPIFFTEPFCPDRLVYCGVNVAELSTLADEKALADYKEKYYELPKVVIYDTQVFIIAKNVKKAREIEELLKFHVMTLNVTGTNGINYLERSELAYLANWEAEAFRRKL